MGRENAIFCELNYIINAKMPKECQSDCVKGVWIYSMNGFGVCLRVGFLMDSHPFFILKCLSRMTVAWLF